MKTAKAGIVVMMLGFGLSNGWAATGVAEMQGTAPNSTIKGTVQFEDTGAGLQVKAHLVNVPPGPHAFHIHEFGSCADMGKAAGSHYNPAMAPHGLEPKDGPHHAHAGDMGNITADAAGSATLEVVLPGVAMSESRYAVGGRAVILHEKLDDFSQPAGNAGSRIACGLIVITGPAPSAQAAPATK